MVVSLLCSNWNSTTASNQYTPWFILHPWSAVSRRMVETGRGFYHLSLLRVYTKVKSHSFVNYAEICFFNLFCIFRLEGSTYYNVTSGTSQMTIVFHSDYSSNYRGFSAMLSISTGMHLLKFQQGYLSTRIVRDCPMIFLEHDFILSFANGDI